MRIGIDASRAFGSERTGTEEYSYQMIKHLLVLPEAKKHEWVLYVREKPGFFAEAQNDNVTIEKIGMRYLWTQVGLASRTWIDNLDVLWVPAHTLPVLRKPGLKTVVTVHGIEYEWLPAYENALQRWYLPLSTQYAVGSATKIIAVSEFTKKQLVERLGARDEKISVIYEGVEGSLHSGRDDNVLQKFGLQHHKYLLFVGTVQPRKNLVRLIEAYTRLKGSLDLARDDMMRLVIAGKLGWNYEEVVELAKKQNVLITGYISEAERDSLLRNALVYVQPSITEGFGLPIIEAMRAGVPVVSSNGGALSEVVGDAGVLFDPYDIDDIRNKLQMVLESKALRNKLIVAGSGRVDKFSWEKAAMSTFSILTSL